MSFPFYNERNLLVTLSRRDKNKIEESKNHAPWIEKLWPATTYPEGYDERAPYCAAGLAYNLRAWIQDPAVLTALKLTLPQAEKWRCKSAAAFSWESWAKKNNVQVLPANTILHLADIAIYSYSHIELVTDDDGTNDGPFVALGYNTNAAGARDGEGCFEKPRTRKGVKCFLRILR